MDTDWNAKGETPIVTMHNNYNRIQHHKKFDLVTITSTERFYTVFCEGGLVTVQDVPGTNERGEVPL